MNEDLEDRVSELTGLPSVTNVRFGIRRTAGLMLILFGTKLLDGDDFYVGDEYR